MTTDPVALRLAQPLVDRLGIDPRPHAERFSDIYLMAAVTSIAVDVATIDLPGIWAASVLYLIGAIGLRIICRTTAANGLIVLQMQPLGLLHVLMRISLFHVLMFSAMDLTIAVRTGLAPLVPISTFRWLLDGVTAAIGLVALYLSICRRPPPRRRTRKRVRRLLPMLPALLAPASCAGPGLQPQNDYLAALEKAGSTSPPVVRVRLLHSYSEPGQVRCVLADSLISARVADTGGAATVQSYGAALAWLRQSTDHTLQFETTAAWKHFETGYPPEEIAAACRMIRAGHRAVIADMTARATIADERP